MNQQFRIYYQNKYYMYSTSWNYASSLDSTIMLCPTQEVAWRTCMELDKKYPQYIFRYDVV